MWHKVFTYSTGGGHVHQLQRRGRQRVRDGRQVREGRRKGHEGGPRVPGPGRGQGARGVPEQGQGPVLLRPGDGRVRARAGGRRGAEEAQRPRRSPDARRVVRRRVPAGLVPALERADGLRRRVRPRRARHGAGAAGVLRAHRPRQPPRRGLVGAHLREAPLPQGQDGLPEGQRVPGRPRQRGRQAPLRGRVPGPRRQAEGGGRRRARRRHPHRLHGAAQLLPPSRHGRRQPQRPGRRGGPPHLRRAARHGPAPLLPPRRRQRDRRGHGHPHHRRARGDGRRTPGSPSSTPGTTRTRAPTR